MEHSSEIFFSSQQYVWEEVAPGVTRKITGYNDSIMMVLVKFDKGSIGDPHNHPHSQSTYVESGEFEVTIDGNTQILKKGDCFCAPPNAIHGVVCKAEGLLVDVFSPVREDFL
jgi:quercetin dioxygenase-like cupin family protein